MALHKQRPGQYVFAPELGYFEFLPQDEGASTQVCDIKSLELGKKYEMIHTGYAGLYRYRMSDILEVTGFYNSAPVIKFCYRREHCVNVAGEKMDMEKISNAVKEFSQIYDTAIEHFCVYPQTDKIPAEYMLLLEVPQAGKPNVSEKEAAETMDRLLRQQNMDYDDCRRL